MWTNPQCTEEFWSHLLKKSLMENFLICAVFRNWKLENKSWNKISVILYYMQF